MHNQIDSLLMLIPACPLAAFLLLAFFGRMFGKLSHLPVILAFAASFALSVMLLFQVQTEIKNPPAEKSTKSIGYEHICTLWTWASVQNAYSQRAAPACRWLSNRRAASTSPSRCEPIRSPCSCYAWSR